MDAKLTTWSPLHTDIMGTTTPDDRTVLTYVSSYYHTFAGVQKVRVP